MSIEHVLVVEERSLESKLLGWDNSEGVIEQCTTMWCEIGMVKR